MYECVAKNTEGIAKTSAVVTVIGKSLNTPWHIKYITKLQLSKFDVVCMCLHNTKNTLIIIAFLFMSYQNFSEALLTSCSLVITTNSSGLTYEKSPLTENLWLSGMPSEFLLEFYDLGSGWGSIPWGHDLCEVLRGPLMSAGDWLLQLSGDWKRTVDNCMRRLFCYWVCSCVIYM